MLNLQNDVDNTTRQYLKSIKNNKALTKAEEHSLLRRYRDNNDLDARNKIITSNLKFSCKLANQYRNRGLSFNDLISEANKGLIDSIDKFDLSQDVKFFSYAKWWIIQRIQTALEKNCEIKSYELTESVSNRLKSDDQDDEDEERENTTYNPLSSINEEAEGENKKRKELVENILSKLTERESDIIKKYYGIGEEKLNLEEIGEKYSITKERVRQIMEATFRKMRSEALLNNK